MRKLAISYAFLFTLGFAGAHRFYLHRYYTAGLFLFTGGFCFLGVILDFFMLPFMVAEDMDKEGGDVLGFFLALALGCGAFAAFCFLVSLMLAGLLSL